MEQKKFNCKQEEVTAIAGFVANSLTADLALFQEYSPAFTQTLIEQIRTKQNLCISLEESDITTQRLKSVTAQLVDKEQGLRPILNKVEGYLKLAGSGLDIAVDSFGLKAVRDAVSRGNDEGVIASLQTLVKNINRNLPVLLAQGLKPEIADALMAVSAEIKQLNEEQNQLINDRSRNTDANIKDYNELWNMITPVFETARSIFRGVDEVKLKEYTISALLKRVNAEGK